MLFSNVGSTFWTNGTASSSVHTITREVMLLTSSRVGMRRGQTLEEDTFTPGTTFLSLLRHIEAYLDQFWPKYPQGNNLGSFKRLEHKTTSQFTWWTCGMFFDAVARATPLVLCGTS